MEEKVIAEVRSMLCTTCCSGPQNWLIESLSEMKVLGMALIQVLSGIHINNECSSFRNWDFWTVVESDEKHVENVGRLGKHAKIAPRMEKRTFRGMQIKTVVCDPVTLSPFFRNPVGNGLLGGVPMRHLLFLIVRHVQNYLISFYNSQLHSLPV